MRYAFIDTHRRTWPVDRLCSSLTVSRSGYYAWRTRSESPRVQANRTLLRHIRVLHAEAREAYGAVKMWRTLQARGIACGRHRVARLRRFVRPSSYGWRV